MNKTSKEYAEKLAKDFSVRYKREDYLDELVTGVSLVSHESGYMTAIEENNVPELIEALEKIANSPRPFNESEKEVWIRVAREIAINALKKSKEI